MLLLDMHVWVSHLHCICVCVCRKVEQMKHCFYNATYHQVPYFNRELTRPCASYADYMRSLIQLTSNLTTSTCQSPASTWQQTCPSSDIVIGKHCHSLIE